MLALNEVDDAEIANAQTEELLGALQLLDTSRPRLILQPLDPFQDLPLRLFREIA